MPISGCHDSGNFQPPLPRFPSRLAPRRMSGMTIGGGGDGRLLGGALELKKTIVIPESPPLGGAFIAMCHRFRADSGGGTRFPHRLLTTQTNRAAEKRIQRRTIPADIAL